MMLQAQAFGRAVKDAGLQKSDVDGLASAGYGGMHEVQLAEYLGLSPRWLESTSVGGSSFEFQAMHAYRAIQAGDVDTVAIVYGNNQLTAFGRTLGTGGGGGRGGMAMPLPMSYEFPTGITLVGSYAMAARRHMHEYRTTPEQLASIAVQTREHAARNPDAMYRDPITIDDVLSSKLVADPLHKLDCCVISDGGCCIILTTEERARDLPHRPVYVRGAAGGTTHHSIQGMADMTVTAAAVSGPKAFAEAGITPGDVDVFAMYDSFTYTVLVVVEDLGFWRLVSGDEKYSEDEDRDGTDRLDHTSRGHGRGTSFGVNSGAAEYAGSLSGLSATDTAPRAAIPAIRNQ